MVQTSTIVAASVGTVATGLVAYAIYFDHKRRTDPNFRKQLKKESKRQAKAAKEEAEAYTERQKEVIKAVVLEAKEDGFPRRRLKLRWWRPIEAALCFYKALKVYPQPNDLISIYDKTVPKPVLDILAEMIAADAALDVGPFGGGPGSDSGIPGVGLD
ncbi:hypothetical protein DID88_005300 [Monilinia fructigena]|uniref:Mitochondrial import receptor subunit tom-20 n=1 Tax=Monilinia fructigena TaxID=38457 RepID=A0A395J0N1_9HELO|nr:hypothetical protein DID88_005300 [Monilinia fructigena]